MRSLLASINCSANSTGSLKMPGSKRSRRSATTTWRSAACRRNAPITPGWRRNSPSTWLPPRPIAISAAGPVSNPGGPAFRPGHGRGHRDAPVRLRRLGRYRQHRRAPRGGRSAQSRARVCDDGEKAGKRLQLRWPTQDRHQGRPRAGGIFRMLSPLMMSRIFRSPSVAGGHSREEGTPMSDMRRREFIVLLGGAAAWPLAMRAQQSSDGGPLIGLLSPLSAGTATRNIEGFRAGLRELGYFEGRNVTLALRFAEGMPERMPALATELVGLKPDVIVAAPETSLLAVRNVTRTIPIITIWLQDPVASGAVESIARPSGHVTGTWIAGDDALVGKRLELIKEAVPTIARIGVLVSPTEVQDSVIMRPLSAPAHALGLTVAITLLQRQSRGAHWTSDARPIAADLRAVFVRRGWLSGFLWPQFRRNAPSRRLLRRPHSQRRAPRRPAGRAADQIRSCREPQAR